MGDTHASYSLYHCAGAWEQSGAHSTALSTGVNSQCTPRCQNDTLETSHEAVISHTPAKDTPSYSLYHCAGAWEQSGAHSTALSTGVNSQCTPRCQNDTLETSHEAVISHTPAKDTPSYSLYHCAGAWEQSGAHSTALSTGVNSQCTPRCQNDTLETSHEAVISHTPAKDTPSYSLYHCAGAWEQSGAHSTALSTGVNSQCTPRCQNDTLETSHEAVISHTPAKDTPSYSLYHCAGAWEQSGAHSTALSTGVNSQCTPRCQNDTLETSHEAVISHTPAKDTPSYSLYHCAGAWEQSGAHSTALSTGVNSQCTPRCQNDTLETSHEAVISHTPAKDTPSYSLYHCAGAWEQSGAHSTALSTGVNSQCTPRCQNDTLETSHEAVISHTPAKDTPSYSLYHCAGAWEQSGAHSTALSTGVNSQCTPRCQNDTLETSHEAVISHTPAKDTPSYSLYHCAGAWEQSGAHSTALSTGVNSQCTPRCQNDTLETSHEAVISHTPAKDTPSYSLYHCAGAWEQSGAHSTALSTGVNSQCTPRCQNDTLETSHEAVISHTPAKDTPSYSLYHCAGAWEQSGAHSTALSTGVNSQCTPRCQNDTLETSHEAVISHTPAKDTPSYSLYHCAGAWEQSGAHSTALSTGVNSQCTPRCQNDTLETSHEAVISHTPAKDTPSYSLYHCAGAWEQSGAHSTALSTGVNSQCTPRCQNDTLETSHEAVISHTPAKDTPSYSLYHCAGAWEQSGAHSTALSTGVNSQCTPRCQNDTLETSHEAVISHTPAKDTPSYSLYHCAGAWEQSGAHSTALSTGVNSQCTPRCQNDTLETSHEAVISHTPAKDTPSYSLYHCAGAWEQSGAHSTALSTGVNSQCTPRCQNDTLETSHEAVISHTPAKDTPSYSLYHCAGAWEQSGAHSTALSTGVNSQCTPRCQNDTLETSHEAVISHTPAKDTPSYSLYHCAGAWEQSGAHSTALSTGVNSQCTPRCQNDTLETSHEAVISHTPAKDTPSYSLYHCAGAWEQSGAHSTALSTGVNSQCTPRCQNDTLETSHEAVISHTPAKDTPSYSLYHCAGAWEQSGDTPSYSAVNRCQLTVYTTLSK